jgi:hypothetical protein
MGEEMPGFITWELTVMAIVKQNGAQSVMTVSLADDEGEKWALVVFERRETAQRYKEETGNYAGHGLVGVDEARIAALLARYDLRWVAMPKAFLDAERMDVDLIEGEKFLELLGRSIRSC